MSKSDIASLCKEIFGVDYTAIQKTLYPKVKYKTYLLTKKSGGLRAISEPRVPLKKLQRTLLEHLEKVCGFPRACVHGFVKKRNIVSNAAEHCARRTSFVLNIDLTQ